MKILINTLFLAIVVLVNFGELDAVENEGLSSESGKGHGTFRFGRGRAGRRRGSLSRREDGIIRGHFHVYPTFRTKPVRLTRNSDGFITYMNQLIEVWLDERTEQRIVQADYPNNKCPSGRGHETNNYLVRLVILKGGQRIVECLDQNGRLLGVRPSIETIQNVMEPNSEQWFFVYERKVFRVRINPETKAVMSITLAGNKKNEAAEVRSERREVADMAGFKFRVIRSLPYYHIIGAEPILPPAPPTVVHDFRDLISSLKAQ